MKTKDAHLLPPGTPDPEGRGAAREAEALWYQTLFNRINDAVLVYPLTPEGRPGCFIEANEAACDRLGYRREDLLRMTVYDIIDPQTVDVGAHLARLSAREKIVFEAEHLARDGRRLPVEISAHLFARNGCPTVLAVCRDVTERKEAELAARHLAAIVASSNDAIIGKTLDGTITSWNAAAERIYGYRAEEVLGRTIDLIVPPDRREELQAIFESLERGERVDSFETVRLTRDGRRIGISLTVSPICDGTGRVVGASAVARDVTTRTRMAKQLRQREQQLTDFVENAPIGLHWVGPDGIIQWANRAQLDLLGYAREEYVGQHIGTFHVDRETIKDIHRRLLAGETLHNVEARLRCKDGSIRQVLINSSVYREGGAFVHTRCFLLDVTERKQSQEALLENERHLRFTLEAARVGTWEWDLRTDEVTWSDNIEAIHGMAPGTFDGTFEAVLADVDPADRQQVQRAIECAIEQHEDYHVEYRLAPRNGAVIWVEGKGRVIYDEAGRPVQMAGICTDVTERKRAEEQLRELNETLERRVAERTAELEKANLLLTHRNRELQDFAYVASHDLQEPLRKIHAFADLLGQDYQDLVDETGRYYLDRMQNAAARMALLIKDLLAFSRIATRGGAFRRVDLNEVLAGVLSDLEVSISEAEAAVEIDRLPAIEADATQMRQLLQNLIGNALKFHPTEARPCIRVCGALVPGEALAGAGGQVLRLQVQDNGIGFDEKYVERIFSPFQRLNGRSAYAGTGMGLAICRRIVERHRGLITATSTPGEGATFTVLLPVQQGREAEAPEQEG